MASSMKEISERLEEVFHDLYCTENDRDKDLSEIVQLLSLDTDECERHFTQNPYLYKKYFTQEVEDELVLQIEEKARTESEISEPETESVKTQDPDSSDEENVHPVRFRNDNWNISDDDQPRVKKERYESTFYETKPKFPRHFEMPSNSGTSKEINTINIDCIPDLDFRKKILDKWLTEISLTIQTNSKEFTTARAVLTLLEHKSGGNIKTFIKKALWDENQTGPQVLDEATKGLYTMFLGLDYVSNALEQEQKLRQKAVDAMTKAQLCDICRLDEFTCLFEKNINLVDLKDYPIWIDVYLRKIPIIGQQARDRWEKEATIPSKHSIAFATRIVKDEIAKYCDFRKTSKRLKSFGQRCCNQYKEPNYNIGCKEPTCKPTYKKKKYTRPKPKYKKWVKKKRKFQPGKFFKKKPKGDEKPKKNFCPQGKKKCRCWICSEEGHYANECPSRKSYPEKVSLLQEAHDHNFYPVEDEYDDYLNIYVVTTDDESSGTE
nr:Capsid protein [Dahlia mosaic virus]